MPNTLGEPLLLAALLLVAGYVLGRKFGRVRYAVPVALLIIAALGFWYWDAIGKQEQWSRATVTREMSLSVRYLGSSCEDQRSVDVDENDDSVKITITTRSFARACDSAAHPRRVTVNLNQPHGDRKLLDGACSPACVRPPPSTSPENAEAVAKVADRIAELGEGGGFSGQEVDEEHRALTVYWKGTAPASVRRYAESSPDGVEVTIQAGVKYSKADLAKAVSRVFNDPMGRELNITFVNDEYDGSGISVGISGDSITGAQHARLSEVAGVDITGVEFNAEIDLLN